MKVVNRGSLGGRQEGRGCRRALGRAGFLFPQLARRLEGRTQEGERLSPETSRHWVQPQAPLR